MALPTPKIGTFAYGTHFSDWQTSKPLKYPQKAVGVFFTDGVDGGGGLIGSKRPETGTVKTSYLAADGRTAAQQVQQYIALVGTLIQVTDEWGVGWLNVLVMPIDYLFVPVSTPSLFVSLDVTWSLLPSLENT